MRVWVVPSFGTLAALGMRAVLLVFEAAEVDPKLWNVAPADVLIGVDVGVTVVFAAVDAAASAGVEGVGVFDDPPQPVANNRIVAAKTAARRTMISP